MSLISVKHLMALKKYFYWVTATLLTTFFESTQNQLKPLHNIESRFPSHIFNRYLVTVCEITSQTHVEICGGSLITSMWVLASQNCRSQQKTGRNTEENHFIVTNVDDIGALSLSPKRKVLLWIMHNEYGNSKTANNFLKIFKPKIILGKTPQLTEDDISLLKLETNVMLNINTRPVMLVKYSKKPFSEIFSKCTFRFWPTKKEAISFSNDYDWKVQRKDLLLINSAVEIMPMSKCLEEHKDILLTSYQVCGRHLEKEYNSFLNNSGGPLICNKLQVGFFSWQKDFNSSVLLIFTRTDAYNRYIKQNIPSAIFYDGGLPKNTRRSMDAYDFLLDSGYSGRMLLFLLITEIFILLCI